MLTRNVLTATLLSLTVFHPAAARAEITPITQVEGISEFRLDNGLKVLLFPDESKPTVTVNITYFVGSRHEGYGEAGMAHLLEHMLFKGTPTHKDIPQLLKDRGAQLNGTTWLDRTNYYETLPSSDENLEFALQLEADRMINSNVAEEDLKSEFSVVRNEFERGENSPVRVLWQRMVSAAFLWHNYGNSTIGNRADIERVPIQNLKRFYERYYQPDNAMLVVAGKFNPAKALEFTDKYFGSIPKPDRVLDKTYTVEPAQDGERFVTLRRAGKVAAVGAVYHVPSGPHPEYAAVAVLDAMLTAQPAGRLYKKLVETKKASFTYGLIFSLHDPGIQLLLAEVNKGNDPQLVLEEMIDVVEGFGESEITEEDVQRAKQQLLKDWELSASNSTRIAIGLSDWASQGDWRLYFLYRDRLEKVTAEDVRHVAQSYFQRNNRTAGVYIPTDESERVSVPETPNLAEMIGDYKGREAIAQGEAFDVSPENVESRTTRLKINGNVKVALLPKKSRGESVVLKLTLRYGTEESLHGKTTLCEFLPLMMKRGTEKFSRQELEDELDRSFAQLSASGGAGSAQFSLQTKREHLPKAIELLGHVLRHPTFPESELEIIRAQQVTSMEEALVEPNVLAQRGTQRKISPYKIGHPLYQPTLEEEIEMVKAVDRSQLQELYSDFLGGTNGELTIVGDFDPEPTMAALGEVLGDWKAKADYVRITRIGDVELKASTEDINTPDKANAMYFAATVFPLRDDASEYPALLIGNHILGGGALANRLGNRVRQKDGLSYGIRSGLSVSSLDERTVFYIYAISNPGNMAKVKTAIREELDLLRKDGVTDEELEAAKKGWLQSREVSRSSESSLASVLAGTSLTDRTMDFHAGLETKVRSVTSEQVLETVRKYLDPERIVIVTAGDYEKAKEDAGDGE